MVKDKTTYWVIGIIIVILIALIIILTQKSTAGVVKIGIITPLSGELATYGQGTLNAAKLAVEKINSQETGLEIEIIAEDSPCNPTTAISALNKLQSIDDVDVILGPLCSSELLAISPILNKDKLVLISPSATSPEITDAGDYIFRTVASDDLRAKVFANYLINENILSIAIIYENDDAGVGFEQAFVKEYKNLGGNILIEEVYELGVSDMRSQLTKIKDKNPENMLMLSYPAETGRILVQSEELGIEARFFEGFEVMSDPQVEEIAGDLVNGVTYIQSASLGEEAENFKTSYMESYGNEAPYYSAEAYDIVMVYAEVLKKDSNLNNLKKNLYTIKDFKGVSGTITFDENGDVLKPFEIGEIQGGELVALKIV